jgi:hypothetical protein
MRWFSLVPEDITEKDRDAILRLDSPFVFKWNERMNMEHSDKLVDRWKPKS